MMILETPKKYIKLNCNEIHYCIMFSPYIDIHTSSEKITVRKKISELEREIPSKYFIRCHRSYIVNLKYVKSITKDSVVLESGIRIPISRGRYKDINDTFINYICE